MARPPPPLKSPTAEELLKLLDRLELTWIEIAERTFIPVNTWEGWLRGVTTMKPYIWHYVQIMVCPKYRAAWLRTLES